MRWLMCLLALSLLLTGCRTTDRDLFEQAEDCYKRKEHDEALKRYRLLSDEHPDSEWAAVSLQRQGQILSARPEGAEEAVRVYQRLVAQFPNSELAPTAQLAIGDLCYRKLQRYEESVAAYNRALDEYGADPDIAAQAQLALGKVAYEMGSERSIEHLTVVLRDYSSDRPRCAEAQLYVARVLENVKRDVSRAVEEYSKVIDRYPDTQWAEEAKKSIGWIYYYTGRGGQGDQEEPTQVLLTLRRAKAGTRESLSVPPFIRSVGNCLLSLNVETTASYLMGISGLAFQFYYDRDDRLGGADHLPQNPLAALCRALGLTAFQREAASFQEGFESLRKHLVEGQPAFVPLVVPPPSWVTVIGFDSAEKTVTFVEAGGATKSLSWEDLATGWSTRSCPSLDPTKARGPRFTWCAFKRSGAPASRAKTAERAVLAGTRMMQDKRSGRFAGGFRAYEELIDDLQTPRDYAGNDNRDQAQLARWAQASLPRLIAARKAASAFLRGSAKDLSAEKRSYAEAAAALFDSAAQRLQSIPLQTQAANSDGTEFAHACERTAQALEEVIATEQGALAQMEQICR